MSSDFLSLGARIINVTQICTIDKKPGGTSVISFSNGDSVALDVEETHSLLGVIGDRLSLHIPQ